MNQNLVSWLEIYVQDLERAQRFYESVLEIKLEKLIAPDTSNAPSPSDFPRAEMLGFPAV